jgi:hypothetical protein
MLGCSAPDPRSVEGILQRLMSAVESEDRRALFQLLDFRARSALHSIAKDRARAARVIAADYPEPERTTARAALGEAPEQNDPHAIFERRCPAACLAELASQLGAPAEEREVGGEIEVHTRRGTRLRLYRDREGRLGRVWRTAELEAEKVRANRELLQIRGNAEVYRRRRALDYRGAR